MINLLPPQARKDVVRTYWSRVLTVWALLLCSAGIVGGCMLLPTYVLLSSQYAALQAEASSYASVGEEGAATEKVIRETNALATSLIRMDTRAALGDVFRALDAAQDDAIDITAHSLSRNESGGIAAFRVQGVAQSRAALTNFTDNLKDDPLFERVDLPISDLVRDTDLPFTLDVVVTNNGV